MLGEAHPGGQDLRRCRFLRNEFVQFMGRALGNGWPR